MTTSRMDKYKDKRDNIKNFNDTKKQNKIKAEKLSIISKSVDNISPNISGVVSSAASIKKLNSHKTEHILESIDMNKLHNTVDSKKLNDVLKNIRTDSKASDYDDTEIQILKKVAHSDIDPTKIIDPRKIDKNAVTAIINDILKEKQQKDVTHERDRIALQNLKEQVSKGLPENIVDSKDMFDNVFTESEMERIKSIKLQKIAEVDNEASWGKIVFIILLLLTIFFITISVLKRMSGG